jgi:hypothetical protein
VASAGPAAAAPSGPAGEITALTAAMPSGWKRENHDDSKLVYFEGPRGDRGQKAAARIDAAPAGAPTTASAYLAYLLKGEWSGNKAELVTEESWSGGFAATYRVKGGPDPKPMLSFFAIWDVGGKKLRCEGVEVPDEKARDAVKEVCKSAHW